MDRKNVIKGLEETKIMITQAVDRGGQMSVYGAYKCLNNVTDALALLKEQKWHIFHEDEDGIMDVECVPNNGEEFLWYRKCFGCMYVAPWGDDDWAEYACTSDGEPFEDGDAWMQLPKPPKQ